MIYLLTIGYEQYAFPSSRGLQTVVDALSRARRVSSSSHVYPSYLELEREIALDPKPVVVSLLTLPNHSFTKSRREVLEPEVLPPERRRLDGRKALACGTRGAITGQTRLALGEGGE